MIANPTRMKRLRLPIRSAFAVIMSCLVFLIVTDASGATRRVKIASAQIFCLDGDRSGNLVRVENAVRTARALGADLVAFPESCILGWENPEAHKRAFPIPGEDSDVLCKLAKEYKIYVCIGLDEKADGNLYGAAILIDEKGTILLKHRKNNVLPELMTPPYSTGSGVEAVDTPLGRIGVMICADSFRQELLTQMKGLKPDFVLIPYGWAAEESKWPAHGNELKKTVQKAARHIGCTVVGTDLVGEISHGPWTGQVYGGQSVASDAQGKVLFVSKDRDLDMSVITVKTKPPR